MHRHAAAGDARRLLARFRIDVTGAQVFPTAVIERAVVAQPLHGHLQERGALARNRGDRLRERAWLVGARIFLPDADDLHRHHGARRGALHEGDVEPAVGRDAEVVLVAHLGAELRLHADDRDVLRHAHVRAERDHELPLARRLAARAPPGEREPERQEPT